LEIYSDYRWLWLLILGYPFREICWKIARMRSENAKILRKQFSISRLDREPRKMFRTGRLNSRAREMCGNLLWLGKFTLGTEKGDKKFSAETLPP
jgi:hypothetical protein